MVFSSSLFLFFVLPITLLVYYLMPARFRNLWIVIVSILFYSWGAPKYIFVVLTGMLFDFVFAKLIHNAEGLRKKQLLFVAVSCNVAALLYFKYFNFFVDNLNSVLTSVDQPVLQFAKVALPIGISFFTFHEISYLVDVYRARKMPFSNIIDYALYILFFPQLIAGPIIRFNEISDQISNYARKIPVDYMLTGFYRFVIGLAKKVLIANVCGLQADLIFGMPTNDLSTPVAWIGALAYAMQIYFDFSGYSDMAIGIARMMGFVFPENFNSPYISTSITEFWRRWHMTLSRWIRDYLYISLGGNKVSEGRMYFNLVVCFLISGFWHGAEWTFIIWGLFHGIFLILDKLFLLKLFVRIGKAPSMLITFLLTLIGWVIFRSPDFNHALEFIHKMFAFNWNGTALHYTNEFRITLIAALVFSFGAATKFGDRIMNAVYSVVLNANRTPWYTLASLVILLLAASAITTTGFNPFIYFRF